MSKLNSNTKSEDCSEFWFYDQNITNNICNHILEILINRNIQLKINYVNFFL